MARRVETIKRAGKRRARRRRPARTGAAAGLSRRALLQSLLLGVVQSAARPKRLAAQPAGNPLYEQQLVLCVLGTFQPASAAEVHHVLDKLYEAALNENLAANMVRPELSAVERIVTELAKPPSTISAFPDGAMPLILQVEESPLRFSLTLAGQQKLSTRYRLVRDKTRLFLFKGPRETMISASRGVDNNGVGGGSPSVGPTMRSIEMLTRPIEGRAAPDLRWVGFYAVFNTGTVSSPRDAPLNLLSFATLEQLGAAGGLEPEGEPDNAGKISSDGLALCLGISRSLLNSMASKEYRPKYYSIFTVAKSGKGERTIQSPRVFLKVVQRFVLDFLLPFPGPEEDEYVHAAVHSFRRKRSIITNAMAHRGQAFVANLDIEDFFGSVRPQAVRRLILDKAHIRDKAFEHSQKDEATPTTRVVQTDILQPETASLLSRLCTLTDEAHPLGMLPQGAPTSPMLSNLMLWPIDKRMEEVCGKLGLVYTRYADDITISGPDAASVRLGYLVCRKHLFEPPGSMQVNGKKHALVSKDSRQVVTGIVVNEKILPPSEYRDNVRAAFDKVAKGAAVSSEAMAQLRGHLSYLRSFPDFSKETGDRYKAILDGATVNGAGK